MNNQEKDNVKVLEKNTSKKKKHLSLIIFCFLFSILLIVLGVYLAYISNPKRILGTALENFNMNLKTISAKNDKLNIGQTYTMNSIVNLNIEGDYFATKEETQPYNQLLKNINNTTTNLTVSQDLANKKLLVILNSKLNNQDLILAKYLIENSTEYYFVKDYLNTYINNGSSNYFETLTEEITGTKNLQYILEVIMISIKNNLKEEYFEQYKTTTTISNVEQELKKVSLTLTNKRLKEIATGVLNDLKSDAKANKILTSINENFSKTKISEKTKFLEEKETFIINIYTTNLTSKIKKYECIYQNNTEEEKFTYEPGSSENIAYFIKDNKTLYKMLVKGSNGKYKIDILDADKNTNLGQIIFENSTKRTSLIITFRDNDSEINLNYDVKLSNIKAQKSYHSDVSFALKMTSADKNILSMNITSANDLKNISEITEDVSTSILASSVKEEEKTKKQEQYMLSLFQKLTS